MGKITQEIREKLREPLPGEAVSQHPTKTYLSSIKSIYVAERINDVFGVGSWTLKGEMIERKEEMVVVKAVLEIPEYGFYGEAYGGNDNKDLGDAYKGAVTDGFTKIAGQQLEIGIDVYKGIKADAKTPQKQEKPKYTIKMLVDKAKEKDYSAKLVIGIMTRLWKVSVSKNLSQEQMGELLKIMDEGKYKD